LSLGSEHTGDSIRALEIEFLILFII
jgi:hypothetical protein